MPSSPIAQTCFSIAVLFVSKSSLNLISVPAVNHRGIGLDQPRLGRDFGKAFCPIVATPCQYADRLVPDTDLGPIAVKLDLVQPALIGRRLRGQRRQGRCDKAGEWGLGAWPR